ncbi:MAG: RHS repeat-associated core domain-containing protein, partial [Thermoanaerobaculia bacterium]
LRDVRVKVGTTTVAGTSVEYDGLQVSVSRQLGLASDELTTRFTYDQRSRLLGSMFSSRSQVEPSSSVEGSIEEGNTDADFRFAQTRTSAASTSFEEGVGHKIKSMTRGTDVRQFVHDGPERTDDGSTIYTYNARGRLTTMREKNGITPRRIVFTYSGLNRVVGRRAEYAAINNPRDDRPEDWKLEDRASVIAADGLPADTTFVWDLVTDRLVSVYAAGSNGDPLKQIIHGDAAYDDPLITVTIDPSTGLPTNLYPIFDEAAAGGLQAVLNIDGEIVARNLPNDAYGADDRALTGVVIDRIAIKPVVVDTVLQRVDVTLHATEQLSAESLATGARLALVTRTGTVIRTTPVAPSLADAYTVLWSLPAADWEALIANAPESAALSIAATPSLRASAWTPDTPILPPTLEDARLYTSDETPFELRQPLTTLTPLNASTLYELSTLALAPTGDREPLFEQVFTARFQALPFVEPMNGAVYVRNRWFSPTSGTFLSPDSMGYTDSANLYAFCGGDPINCTDPTGNWGWADAKKAAGNLMQFEIGRLKGRTQDVINTVVNIAKAPAAPIVAGGTAVINAVTDAQIVYSGYQANGIEGAKAAVDQVVAFNNAENEQKKQALLNLIPGVRPFQHTKKSQQAIAQGNYQAAGAEFGHAQTTAAEDVGTVMAVTGAVAGVVSRARAAVPVTTARTTAPAAYTNWGGEFVDDFARVETIPTNAGAVLPEAEVANFVGRPRTVAIGSGEELYGIRDAGSRRLWWTRVEPRGELQWRMDQAVLPRWNKGTTIERMTVPPGQSLIGFEGPARAQGPYLGGGNQIYIPGVPREWTVMGPWPQ